MRFVDSRCIHCGATLKVAQDATHICCQYCKAELQIVREGGEITTQMLGEMNENLGQKLDVLRVQNEVERLDREWSLERETFMVSNQNGARKIPSSAGSLIGGLFAAGFGIVWTVIASSSGAPGIFPMVGVIFVIIAVGTIVVGMSKASAHETAEAAYQRRRQELLRELERVQR